MTEKQIAMPDALPSKETMHSEFDPNGSYTGVPTDQGERPMQDADDL